MSVPRIWPGRWSPRGASFDGSGVNFALFPDHTTHVDGFRFALASARARELREVDKLGAFLAIIHEDPVPSQVKPLAEPWNPGPNGYHAGNFPVLWSEWNEKYRNCVRRFWRGCGGTASKLVSRLAGSSALYAHNARRPSASLNFNTAHDGFTLRALVSYNGTQNEANGEESRDGCNDNDSWICCAEGPTDAAALNTLRARQLRNSPATLILSQGVPTLLAGDESGKTQDGNNNAFCQESPLAWLDWKVTAEQRAVLAFTRDALRRRRTQPVFRRRHFFQGRAIHGEEITDLYWLKPDGAETNDADWNNAHARSLSMGLTGNQITGMGREGERFTGDTAVLDAAPRTFEHMGTFPLMARSLSVVRAEILTTPTS